MLWKKENGGTDVIKRYEDCNKFEGQVGKSLWGSTVREGVTERRGKRNVTAEASRSSHGCTAARGSADASGAGRRREVQAQQRTEGADEVQRCSQLLLRCFEGWS